MDFSKVTALIVPPLVMINKKYYGIKVALYIAGIMYLINSFNFSLCILKSKRGK